MHTGMLWFDNSKITLSEKIRKAMNYYIVKYGRKPDMCLVNPAMFGNDKPEIEGLTVRPYQPVLPGHIWIGMEDKQGEQAA